MAYRKMLKIKNHIVVVVLLFLVAGCATISKEVPDGAKIAADEGLILATVDLKYLNTDRKDTPLLELSYTPENGSPNMAKIFFGSGKEVMLVKAKTGEYVLTHSFFGFDLMSHRERLKFHVKPGKITYLGNFTGVVTWPKIGLQSKRRLEVRSQLQRDKAVLIKNYPNTERQYAVIDGSHPALLANEFNK
jgi:hypothetical protein